MRERLINLITAPNDVTICITIHDYDPHLFMPLLVRIHCLT